MAAARHSMHVLAYPYNCGVHKCMLRRRVRPGRQARPSLSCRISGHSSLLGPAGSVARALLEVGYEGGILRLVDFSDGETAQQN
eukprot:3698468-Pleurochrysis_carterae.AAC.2